MSNGVYIDDSSAALERAIKLLAGIDKGRSLHKAVMAASDRAAKSAETQAGRLAAGRYVIKKSSFTSHVQTKRKTVGGSNGNYSVTISFAGGVIPLIEFGTKFSKDGGVYASVIRGSGGDIAHAFIAPVFGKIGAFEHVNGTTGPVTQKYGPSAAHMMMDEGVVDQMDKVMRETFEKRMDHEVDRILNGWGG